MALTNDQLDDIARFGMAVMLDTALRKLHAQGRTSDAITLIDDCIEHAAHEAVLDARDAWSERS